MQAAAPPSEFITECAGRVEMVAKETESYLRRGQRQKDKKAHACEQSQMTGP